MVVAERKTRDIFKLRLSERWKTQCYRALMKVESKGRPYTTVDHKPKLVSLKTTDTTAIQSMHEVFGGERVKTKEVYKICYQSSRLSSH